MEIKNLKLAIAQWGIEFSYMRMSTFYNFYLFLNLLQNANMILSDIEDVNNHLFL